MYRGNEGSEYIEAFPKFKKWINECCCCHSKGYDPEMPREIGHQEGNLGSYYIRKYFKPLPLDNNGLCPVCSKLTKDNKK